MLYSEFLAGTKAPENKETYDQYRLIEQIYMHCESMSKADAYAIWKRSFGKELKAKRKRMHDRANNLLCSQQDFEALPEGDQEKIVRELDKMYENAWYNRDGCRVSFAPNGRSYTDHFGIVWFIKSVGSYPNGTSVYGLYASVDGTLFDAYYRK